MKNDDISKLKKKFAKNERFMNKKKADEYKPNSGNLLGVKINNPDKVCETKPRNAK